MATATTPSKPEEGTQSAIDDLSSLETVQGVKVVTIRTHSDARGTLVALDEEQGVPFPVRRVFFICDVPQGQQRAGHAVSSEFLLVVVSGCVTIAVSDGTRHAEAVLISGGRAVHTMPGVFIELKNFDPGTVLLSLSSKLYSEVEYSTDAFDSGRSDATGWKQ